MRVEVARDLSASAADFLRVVWPAIRSKCGGGELEPVESVTAEGFAKTLDVMSGIDAWQVVDGLGIRGIASRVQWGDTDWATFTVRKTRTSGARTEWDKIEQAARLAERGFIRCHLVVQAYVAGRRGDGGPLLNAYVVRAPDLYSFCKEQYRDAIWFERTNRYDGNTMAVFPVDRLRAHGCDVFDTRSSARAAA